MLTDWAGSTTFVEDAEEDPDIQYLNISAHKVYDNVLEDIDNPEKYEAAADKLAAWQTGKEEESYRKGVDIREQKKKELSESFTATSSGGSKTEGMTAPQRYEYYKNLA